MRLPVRLVNCRSIGVYSPQSRLIVVVGLLSAIGCGGAEFSPVEGVVTLNEKPLPGATVVFQSPQMPLATAKTNSEGRYRVETGGTQGMKPGEYAVTISAYDKPDPAEGDAAPALAVPEKYVQAESSGLKAVIVRGDNLNVNFDLSGELGAPEEEGPDSRYQVDSDS